MISAEPDVSGIDAMFGILRGSGRGNPDGFKNGTGPASAGSDGEWLIGSEGRSTPEAAGLDCGRYGVLQREPKLTGDAGWEGSLPWLFASLLAVVAEGKGCPGEAALRETLADGRDIEREGEETARVGPY
jgi:hypothetical protein